MITMERGKYYMGGKVEGLALPTRVFPCATPAGACVLDGRASRRLNAAVWGVDGAALGRLACGCG